MTAIVLGYLVLGFGAGALSGLIGIGGGIVIIPALLAFFGMTQQQAQGTTLALMVPPIGLLAAWTYYRQGYVDLRAAGLICAGFVLGGLLGAKIAVGLPGTLLRRLFGGAMMLLSLRMLFGP
ncbi:MAG: sulfite exporter TauE/SafE family protein [Deltaproteobacteria bacterium]|nr:sulfite exporter TauE/SafE family protein [Deltaproteobacteria bacterium]